MQSAERKVQSEGQKTTAKPRLSQIVAMAKIRAHHYMAEPARRRKAREGFLRWAMSREDAAWLRGLLHTLSR